MRKSLRYVKGCDPLAKAAMIAQKLFALIWKWKTQRHRQNHLPTPLRCAAGFVLLLFCAFPSHAQDVRVNCYTESCQVTPTGGISWANANLTFIFAPISPRVSIYIYIHNNNTSSAHTSQTISVYQTPFGVGVAPSLSANADKWVQDSVQQNATAGASCSSVNAASPSSPGASGLGSCMVMATFSTQIAVKISGAAAQSGSPDTLDLAIVQVPEQSMSGSSGSPGSQTFSSANSGPSSPEPIQVASDALQSAFFSTSNLGSITSGESILAVNNVSGSAKNVYFRNVTISTAIAASFEIETYDTAGSGCSTVNVVNMNVNSAVSPVAQATYQCSSGLGGGHVYTLVSLPASSQFTIDLSGFISASNAVTGIDILAETTGSGVVNTTLTWYEK